MFYVFGRHDLLSLSLTHNHQCFPDDDDDDVEWEDARDVCGWIDAIKKKWEEVNDEIARILQSFPVNTSTRLTFLFLYSR